MCHCKGIVKIVVGLLLLLNAFIWPQWVDLTGWISFGAILLVIGGIALLFKGGHCCDSHCCEDKPKKKK